MRFNVRLLPGGGRSVIAANDGACCLSFDFLHQHPILHPRFVSSLFGLQIRQYFKDSEFYVADLEARGLCSSGSSAFVCEEFEPSAATVKVRQRPDRFDPHSVIYRGRMFIRDLRGGAVGMGIAFQPSLIKPVT